jgi:hypothetical protein
VKRLRVLGLVLAVAAAFAAAAGCGLTHKLTGTTHDNKPPETVLFVNGDLDTVNHVVHLYWFGTDSDGKVKGFEWRLMNPEAPADTVWQFTTLTDSIFTVLTPQGYTDTRFSVRAVDDKDETRRRAAVRFATRRWSHGPSQALASTRQARLDQRPAVWTRAATCQLTYRVAGRQRPRPRRWDCFHHADGAIRTNGA